MAGYTRQQAASIVDGRTIAASDLNDEFNQIALALSPSGHTHDGTVGNGPQIGTTGIANLAVTTAKIAADAVTGDKIDETTTITAASFVGPLTGNVDASQATIDSLTITSGTAITSIDTDLSSVSATDNTLASAKAIKAYVDSQVTAQDLDIQGDTGGALSIDLATETLTIAGGTGVSTSGTDNTITVAIDNTVVTTTGTQTLTDKTLTAPVISSISNTGTLTLPTTTGTLALVAQIPTNNNQLTNGAGYITSYTETDPVFTASAASGITATNISNWDTAYGWGNHASAGYLTSFTESDPVFTASAAGSITGTQVSNWDTAYGWGNHASAGYLTSISDETVQDIVGAMVTDNTQTNITVTYDDATGKLNFVAEATTASPTLTINGDASGSATFTDLGDATLTLTIADDSHNHTISNIDSLQTTLDDKASKTGSNTFSNNNSFTSQVNVAELSTKYTILSSALSSHTIDIDAGQVYYLIMTNSTTFAFNATSLVYSSNAVHSFAIVVTGGSSTTISWPSNVMWVGGTAPAVPSLGKDAVYVFFKLSGSTVYHGFLAGNEMAQV